MDGICVKHVLAPDCRLPKRIALGARPSWHAELVGPAIAGRTGNNFCLFSNELAVVLTTTPSWFCGQVPGMLVLAWTSDLQGLLAVWMKAWHSQHGRQVASSQACKTCRRTKIMSNDGEDRQGCGRAS